MRRDIFEEEIMPSSHVRYIHGERVNDINGQTWITLHYDPIEQKVDGCTVPSLRCKEDSRILIYSGRDHIYTVYSVCYGREKFTTNDTKTWHYIGKGSYNLAYRCNNEVYKIQYSNPHRIQTDEPNRCVRVWNEINNPNDDPALQARVYKDGWIAPFVEGVTPNASEVCNALVDIYSRTRRIVADAISGNFNNFVKQSSSGNIICVDIGAAVRFEKTLEKSKSSLDFWRNFASIYDEWFRKHAPNKQLEPVINMTKALLYIELFCFELSDITELTRNPVLVTTLARAYDDENANVNIAPSLLLTKEAIQAQTDENLFEDPHKHKHAKRQYNVLNALFKLNVPEDKARILARDPAFTYHHLEILTQFFAISETSLNQALNIYLSLGNAADAFIKKYHALTLPAAKTALWNLVFPTKIMDNQTLSFILNSAKEQNLNDVQFKLSIDYFPNGLRADHFKQFYKYRDFTQEHARILVEIKKSNPHFRWKDAFEDLKQKHFSKHYNHVYQMQMNIITLCHFFLSNPTSPNHPAFFKKQNTMAELTVTGKSLLQNILSANNIFSLFQLIENELCVAMHPDQVQQRESMVDDFVLALERMKQRLTDYLLDLDRKDFILLLGESIEETEMPDAKALKSAVINCRTFDEIKTIVEGHERLKVIVNVLDTVIERDQSSDKRRASIA